jgi:hypothetical protein
MRSLIVLVVGFFAGYYAGRNHRSKDTQVVRATSRKQFYDSMNENVNTVLELFESTIRSCLGSECFDEQLRANDMKTIRRVGLLGLEKSGGDILLELLYKALPKDKLDTTLQIIYDSHVPAYGYGKNHGWSSIIRMSRDILSHAYDLMQLSSHSNSQALYAHQVTVDYIPVIKLIF